MAESETFLTVGALREALADSHESDLVVVSVDNLLYHPTFRQGGTILGHRVIIGRGDRAC